MHREQKYTYMQHIEQHREQRREQRREQQNSAHNYRTYSLDYYFEFAYIKNSNTIEIYTISKENI